MRLAIARVGLFGMVAFCAASYAQTQRPPEEILHAREALASKNYTEARDTFAAYLQAHPGNSEAELGLADVELGQHHYAAAELAYRKIVAQQPLLWAAHKNLVIVEAALGRWEEFDRERALLRGARDRGAAGISPHESDLIDAFDVHGADVSSAQHWIVREYYEPVGRSQSRYNFELFAEGRVKEYVSLESADALTKVLNASDVAIGNEPAVSGAKGFALDWYDGKSHGVIAKYAGEPTYEQVRAQFSRWARHQLKTADATIINK